MPGDDHKNMKKIQCWVSSETWEHIEAIGITSPTIAVNRAFALLLENPSKIPDESPEIPVDPQEIPENSRFISTVSPEIPTDPQEIPRVSPEIPLLKALTEEQKAKIEDYKAQIQTLNAEIARLKISIMEAPDPVDLVRLQERNDGLNLVIAEKEKRIEDLTREVTTLNGFAHYFKTAEVKQIEAPANENKKPWWKFW